MARWRPRTVLFVGLGVVFSALFLWLSVRGIDTADLLAHLGRVNPLVFLAYPVLRTTGFAIQALRSRLLFAGLHRFRFGTLMKSVFAAYVINVAIPLRAGDFARVGYLARRGEIPASSVLAVVAFERLLDLLGLGILVLATLGMATSGIIHRAPLIFFVAGVIAVCALIVVVGRRPTWFVRAAAGCAGLFGKTARRFVQARAEQFADGLGQARSMRSLIAVTILSLSFWLLAAVTIRVWLWSFGLSAPWYGPAVVLTFVSLGLAIPSTPGNVGTFHFFTVAALGQLGIAGTDAVAYAVVVHAMEVIPLVVLAIPIIGGEFRSGLLQRGGRDPKNGPLPPENAGQDK